MGKLFSLCGYTGRNTGGIACDEGVGNPRMFMFGGAQFTVQEQATEATLQAAVLDRIQRPNGDAEKLYPFPVINTATDNTEAPQDETAGDGTRRRVREAIKAMNFEMWEVGTTQEAGLSAFSGASLPGFLLTDSGKLCGKHTVDGKFVGQQMRISVDAAGPGTYGATAKTTMSVAWQDSRAFSSNLKWYETSFDPDNFTGLLDAKVVQLASPTGNAHKVGLHVVPTKINGDMDVYDKYSNELAVAGLWRGWTNAGAIITPTSAVKDTSLKGWTVTFGQAVVKIDVVTPDVLADANILGIEGVALAV